MWEIENEIRRESESKKERENAIFDLAIENGRKYLCGVYVILVTNPPHFGTKLFAWLTAFICYAFSFVTFNAVFALFISFLFI